MTAREDGQQGRAEMVDAAQRVAGIIAARARHDHEGARARTLMASFASPEELGGGALLVAELALGLLSRANGRTLDECVGSLSLELAGLPH